jgi:hypothetical protein
MRESLLDQHLGAAARHEHSRPNGDPQPAELRPPEDHLERLARDPALDQRLEITAGRRGLAQQVRLVLREDAPRRPQTLDDAQRKATGT